MPENKTEDFAALIDAVGPQTPEEQAAKETGTAIDETAAIGLQVKADVRRKLRIETELVRQNRLKKQQKYLKEAQEANKKASTTKTQTDAEKLHLKIRELEAHFNR